VMVKNVIKIKSGDHTETVTIPHNRDPKWKR
jgi:hypothetical protein